ncbi:NAD-dependent epimerase/dehydratase family protein [Thalassobaculum sp.]|uniref:NAD-dependent epimerase/dehydratase family protein n=1 Tax=Thalassobaculum sp. TaxID=2022740 RepID=UPI003B58B866
MQFEKVLVTGAGGLLGRYTVEALRDQCSVSGLDVVPAQHDIPHITDSIENLEAVRSAMVGQNAVVHVAARPNIWSGDGHEIIQTNVVGTWNVLQAAEEAGVKRVIVTSSDSVIGFTVMDGAMIPPRYLPVDGDHPRHPTDAYALSKKLCEEMARAFADRGKLEIVVLRPVFVLYPEFECEVIARAENPEGYKGPAAGGRNPAGGGPMWHYIDPRDLARAYRCALETVDPGFGPYFICGPTTLAPEPTINRFTTKTGTTPEIRDPAVYSDNPFAPLYDLSAPAERLGFTAEHDLRRVLGG